MNWLWQIFDPATISAFFSQFQTEMQQPTFWVALDWGTYRTLTAYARLSAAGYEEWLRDYYASTLLAR